MTAPTPTLTLKAGREKSILRNHPWVFSGAVASISGDPDAGSTVDIVSHKGQWLAQGAYSPESQIIARVWHTNQHTTVNAEFFAQRIQSAYQCRQDLGILNITNGYRLVASESDGLSGLIVDVYDSQIVFQSLSQGIEFWLDDIVSALGALFPNHGIYERSDVSVRKKEGLKQRKKVWGGSEPTELITIKENNYALMVDALNGHKTGTYLDQRDSRLAIQDFVKNKTVLNCFSYTGGFSVSALTGGASHVSNMDESQPALDISKQNLLNHNFSEHQFEHIQADVFKQLREYHKQKKTFDVIVLDPPKFADNKSQVVKACRGYKDINLSAMRLLPKGGILASFSCSGLIAPSLFQKTIADAAVDAGRRVRFVRYLNQAPDHPTDSAFPEGHYLKGVICYVD